MHRRGLSPWLRRFRGTSDALRDEFLGYFCGELGHERLRSAPLPAADGGGVLFVSAGIVPLRPRVLAASGSGRAASAQRCLRAGGKHNDLEEVGRTPRHLTLFDMLGNFSFRDYAGADAVHYAWTFLTRRVGLPPDRLVATVLRGDAASRAAWAAVGLPPDRVLDMDERDNFWAMGAEGPCGPCTELHWLVDPDAPVHPGNLLELWNVVLMTHTLGPGGLRSPLPLGGCVDTGMGLERLASVVLGVPSNYLTDRIRPVVEHFAGAASAAVGRTVRWVEPRNPDAPVSPETLALRVLADHARAATQLVLDGVLPAAAGAGYVLRRLIRRAMRFAFLLGAKDQPLLSSAAPVVLANFGRDDDPVAAAALAARVAAVVDAEERLFLGALTRGMAEFDRHVASTGGLCDAQTAFGLITNYGFPLDLVEMLALEAGGAFPAREVDALLRDHRARSDPLAAARAAAKAGRGADTMPDAHGAHQLPPSVAASWPPARAGAFVGYDALRVEGARVTAAYVPADAFAASRNAWVSLDPCPFYAESGGQLADHGELRVPGVAEPFRVVDVRPGTTPSGDAAKVAAAIVKLECPAQVADAAAAARALAVGTAGVSAAVDPVRRKGLEVHHTATHLLHAALQLLVGPDATQAGSLVDADRLRFDVALQSALSDATLRELETWVNSVARSGAPVVTTTEETQAALARGVTGLFGARYGAEVRVVEVPGRSKELCGGTHVRDVGDVYPLLIVRQTGLGSATRRLEAVAGRAAVDHLVRERHRLRDAAAELQVPPGEIEATLRKHTRKIQDLSARLKVLSSTRAGGDAAAAAAARGTSVASLPVLQVASGYRGSVSVMMHGLAAEPGSDEALRDYAAQCTRDDPEFAHVFVAPSGRVLVAADEVQLPHVDCAGLMRDLAASFGGRGGGGSHIARGRIELALSADDPASFAGLAGWVRSQ
jgi:alanyl-tRNA synthetase